MRLVDVGPGRRLAAEAVGEGPALLLVHAGICDARMWEENLPALSAAHRVVRYDLPGYGQSPLPSGRFSTTRDLVGVLDAFGIDRAALLGVSMGARVALEAAVEAPDRVSALLLVAPALREHTWSEGVRMASDEEDEAFERGDFAHAADVCVGTWVVGPRRAADDVDETVRRRVHEMCVRSYELHAEGLAAAAEPPASNAPDPPAAARLGAIDVRTLVLVGDADVPDVLQIADRLEAGIPAARKVVWGGVAHLPSMERPREFERLVLEFLSADGATR